MAAHIWIESELQRHILSGYHWHNYQIIQNEDKVVNELMRKADHRASVEDIWRLDVGGVSLFHYNATLATWFFGLNLVRFEHTPNGGRNLVII